METMTLTLLQTVDTLIEKFSEDCRLRGMSIESIRRYRSSLGIFADYLNSTGLVEIDMKVLKNFLGYLRYERRVKQKTIENNFSALSSFYDYLTFEGIMDKNIILPLGWNT